MQQYSAAWSHGKCVVYAHFGHPSSLRFVHSTAKVTPHDATSRLISEFRVQQFEVLATLQRQAEKQRLLKQCHKDVFILTGAT